MFLQSINKILKHSFFKESVIYGSLSKFLTIPINRAIWYIRDAVRFYEKKEENKLGTTVMGFFSFFIVLPIILYMLPKQIFDLNNENGAKKYNVIYSI